MLQATEGLAEMPQATEGLAEFIGKLRARSPGLKIEMAAPLGEGWTR